MRQFLVSLKKTPMILVVVLVFVIYGFSALGAPAEVNEFAIVTSIGLDRLEDESEGKYEVSLLVFTPVAELNFVENYKVVSAKADSLSDAMYHAGLYIGREVGLSHVKVVVLNERFGQGDLAEELDFLIRNIDMATSTKIVMSNVEAKEVLKVIQKSDSESSIKVSELLNYNNKFIFTEDSSLETFFSGCLGPTKTALLSFIKLENGKREENQGASEQNSGKSESDNNVDIKNDGETVVFFDGKQKFKLSGEQMKAINFLSGTYQEGDISVENITKDDFVDATLIFDIVGKRTDYRVVYENGIPVILINIDLKLLLTEIQNKDGLVGKDVERMVFEDEILDKISSKVKEYVFEAVSIMRENEVDILDFYTFLNNLSPIKFKKFLKTNEGFFLNNVIFKVGTRISIE